MKNFDKVGSGIYAYALHIYLKKQLVNPKESVRYWFMPLPVNRWLMGCLVGLFSTLLTPESEGCGIVSIYYLFSCSLLLLRNLSTWNCFWIDGPPSQAILKSVERWLPSFVTQSQSYCSVQNIIAER